MRNGLIAAMESAEEVLGGDANELEQAKTAAEVAEDTVEVQSDASDAQADAGELVSGLNESEELVEIGEVAQAAVDSGEGLSEQAAEVATIAIERIHQRLGVHKKNLVPAVETFGSANTRLHSTKLIVEGIVDTIKKVWNAVKTMAKQLWEKIKGLWNKLFGSLDSLKKQLEGLRTKAQAVEASATLSEKELKNSSLLSQISVDKKADLNSFKKIAESAQALGVLGAATGQASENVLTDLLTLSGNLRGASDEHVDKVVKATSYLKTEIESVVKRTLDSAKGGALGARRDGKAGDKQKVDAYGPFVGGQYLFVTVTEEDKEKKKPEEITIGFKGEAKDSEKADKADALDKGGVLDVIGVSLKLIEELEKYQKVSKSADAITKDAQKLADKIISEAAKTITESGKNPEASKTLSLMHSAMGKNFAVANSISTQFPVVMRSTVVAGINYASLSINNLK